jgi:hypothetical protein
MEFKIYCKYNFFFIYTPIEKTILTIYLYIFHVLALVSRREKMLFYLLIQHFRWSC